MSMVGLQGSKGKGKGKGQAKPKQKGASQGSPTSLIGGSRQATTQPETQRGTGCTNLDRNQVPEMPGIQLDQPRGLQILRDTLSQATVPGKSYADAAAGSPPMSQSVLTLDKDRGALQTPGGIGDHNRDLAGRVPFENGTFHSTGFRQRQAERPPAAGSQARFGDRRGQEGHRQAGEGRGNPAAGTGGLGTSPTPGDTGYPGIGGRQSGSSPSSTSRNPPAGLCVLIVRRCSRTYLLLPRARRREGGRAKSRTLRGNTEPEGSQRRGSARKIGKGSGIFGFHAESEFEVWGWVLPGSHPRKKLPSPKALAKAAAPFQEKEPPPPAPTAEKEKEATQPTQHDEDSDMHDAQVR